MPKTVDHAQRRAAIADGLVRVAAREGLHAVTMRAVAAEAGVSLRLVQYYFHSKAQLMHSALLHLEERSHQRWAERMRARDGSTRELVAELLAEALPTDEASRAFHLVWTSFAALAMTDAELSAQPFVEGPQRLEEQLTGLLTRAQENGELLASADPAIESARLLALGHGLGTAVLVGQRTADSARTVLTYHLNALFGEAAPNSNPKSRMAETGESAVGPEEFRNLEGIGWDGDLDAMRDDPPEQV